MTIQASYNKLFEEEAQSRRGEDMNPLLRLLYRSPKQVQFELLKVLLIPKSWINRSLSKPTLEASIHDFFVTLDQVVGQIFGPSRACVYGPDDQSIYGRVHTLDDQVISYYIQPCRHEEGDPSQPALFYTGSLDIRKDRINVSQASALLGTLLKDSAIAYNRVDPQAPRLLIFHDRVYTDSSYKLLSSGEELLKKLGIYTAQACEYARCQDGFQWVSVVYQVKSLNPFLIGIT